MPNMTIIEAAEYFGVSKEAIHNRVRRGSLSVSVVDGVKLVEVDTNTKTAPPSPRRTQTKQVNSINSDKYYQFLEEQNSRLHEKVEKLESETRALRDQKEEMLIQERIKIEQIYKDKDEQLKNILGTISSQFMQNTPIAQIEEEHLEAEIEVQEEKPKDKIISLKKYLKSKKISDKKSDKIKARFKKRAKKDNRITTIGKKYYINPIKYDYEDLF